MVKNVFFFGVFMILTSLYPKLYGQGGNCDCWVEPDFTYTTISNANGWAGNNDDGSHGPLLLPFSFSFFDQIVDSTYININGNISFGAPYATFSSVGFPAIGFPIISPFWADADLGNNIAGSNIVQYKMTSTAFYVNWTNVGYFNEQNDKENSFQLIITNGIDPVIGGGNNVSFCYKNMEWTTGDASQGVNGFGGTPARVGANQGNGIDFIILGTYDQPGNAYDGPLGNPDGIDQLDDQYIALSLDDVSNNPSIPLGVSNCDTVIACIGNVTQLEAYFMSIDTMLVISTTSVAPTLSNYSIISNQSSWSAEIITGFIPTFIDQGFHTVTFEGVTNGAPPETTVIELIVQVVESEIDAGNDSVVILCNNQGLFDLFNGLGGTPEPNGMWLNAAGDTVTNIFDPSIGTSGIYSYVIQSTGQCPNDTAVVSVIVDPCSSINELDQEHAFINWIGQDPDGSHSFISSVNNWDYEILDIRGRILKYGSSNSQKLKINFNTERSGVYLLRWRSKSMIGTTRFVHLEM